MFRQLVDLHVVGFEVSFLFKLSFTRGAHMHLGVLAMSVDPVGLHHRPRRCSVGTQSAHEDLGAFENRLSEVLAFHRL